MKQSLIVLALPPRAPPRLNIIHPLCSDHCWWSVSRRLFPFTWCHESRSISKFTLSCMCFIQRSGTSASTITSLDFLLLCSRPVFVRASCSKARAPGWNSMTSRWINFSRDMFSDWMCSLSLATFVLIVSWEVKFCVQTENSVLFSWGHTHQHRIFEEKPEKSPEQRSI